MKNKDLNPDLKKYDVDAETRYRSYRYWHYAKDAEGAKQMFLKKTNKLESFYSSIKVKLSKDQS